jgi:hypothetical protein
LHLEVLLKSVMQFGTFSNINVSSEIFHVILCFKYTQPYMYMYVHTYMYIHVYVYNQESGLWCCSTSGTSLQPEPRHRQKDEIVDHP